MNLIKINVYGEGYHSGAEYNETIFLLEEDYKLLSENLQDKEIYLGELDGKHSEVMGEIDVEIISEACQLNYDFGVSDDGDTLYWELNELTDNLKSMIERANKYISTIDSMTTISFNVRKSQVKTVKEIVNEFITNY